MDPSQSPEPPRGWRRADDPPPVSQNRPNYSGYPSGPGYSNGQNDPNNPDGQAGPNYSNGQNGPGGPGYPNGPGRYPNGPGDQGYGPRGQKSDAPQQPVPPRLTLRPGTYITVRVPQPLSSDHNRAGDGFVATLAKPVVVDGVVVAERGETVGGRVAEAQKAGRVEGVSRLALQLTDLTLVDGQPVPLKSQLISFSGGKSVGRDAAAIGTTTVIGGAIGAAADWGRGAAIGAGAGAAAGIVGVLLTRGHPTVIYPEQLLTFRIDAPVMISTEQAPQAFRYVEPDDYDRPSYAGNRPPPRLAGAPPPAPYYGYAYGYGYPGYYPGYYAGYYPYYWGPGFSFYFGRGYYGRGFYGRGFGGHRR